MMEPNTTCLEHTGNATKFHILGFQVHPELKPLIFFTFLLTYFVTVTGNILIVVMVSVDRYLHSPMYIFLQNLSLVDIFYSTDTVPTMLGCLLPQGITLSFVGCMLQFFCFGCCMSTECLLLTVMAYDRYLAICYPLHYTTLMDHKLCVKLSFACWGAGLFLITVCVTLLCQSEFYGVHDIDHYFCDMTPVLKATCSDTSVLELEVFVMSFFTFSGPFLLIVVSYLFIMSAILRIPSRTGRRKAFSICSSHLSVVAMYFGTLIALYVIPTTGNSLIVSQVMSVLCTVLVPLLNPFIYTLRNKDITQALRKVFNTKIQLSF